MGIIMSALCCTCTGISCACSIAGCCCSVATAGAGGISNTMSKYMNILLLGVVTILCLVLRFYADDWEISFGGFELTICSSAGNETNLDPTNTYEYYAYCKGDAAVYRVSTGLILYFAVMTFLSVCGTALHRGFWFWKTIIVAGACVGMMFVPADSFDINGYIWAARIFSMLFVIIQLFLILGFAYDWNDKWVNNAEKDSSKEKCWLASILICALALYIASMTGVALLYKYYSMCSVGSWITTITLLSSIVFTLLALFREKLTGVEGAVLPSAVISSYITFLAWSALDSNPDSACKPEKLGEDETSAGPLILGMAIAAISMMWVANQSSGTATSFLKGGHGTDVQEANMKSSNPAPLIYEVGEGRSAEDMRRQQERDVPAASSDESNDGEQFNVAIFYVVLIITTLYMSMVVTDWGSSETSNSGNGQMWVRIISQWLTIVLFIWTLLAPAILKDRDFSNPNFASSTRSAGGISGTSIARV